MAEVLSTEEKRQVVEGTKSILESVRDKDPSERVDILVSLLASAMQEAEIPLDEVVERIERRCSTPRN